VSKSRALKGTRDFSRRRFCASALAAAATSLVPGPLLASLQRITRESAGESDVRALSFVNTHTNEKLDAPYWVAGRYQESGLAAIDWIMRDHRTGDVTRMDPSLLDVLHLLRQQLAGAGSPATYAIISGYRSPRSNELLRSRSGAVARHSLHLKGMAADVRLAGVPLRTLHAGALDLRRGGVGYYPDDDFVHVDTGRVRSW
jgi:uncharacterized protein YcbK (DUF882 family)